MTAEQFERILAYLQEMIDAQTRIATALEKIARLQENEMLSKLPTEVLSEYFKK